MNLEKREQELKNLLMRECIDPTKVNIDNIINMVRDEIAATKENT